MNDILKALGIGVIAGVLGGVFGIGGGILIVPALMLFFGFSQMRAQGTSLVALLAPVGLLALIEYHKHGKADIRIGAIVASGFLIGGFFGSRFALSLDESLVRRGFAGFLIVVGIGLMVKR